MSGRDGDGSFTGYLLRKLFNNPARPQLRHVYPGLPVCSRYPCTWAIICCLTGASTKSWVVHMQQVDSEQLFLGVSCCTTILLCVIHLVGPLSTFREEMGLRSLHFLARQQNPHTAAVLRAGSRDTRLLTCSAATPQLWKLLKIAQMNLYDIMFPCSTSVYLS